MGDMIEKSNMLKGMRGNSYDVFKQATGDRTLKNAAKPRQAHSSLSVPANVLCSRKVKASNKPSSEVVWVEGVNAPKPLLDKRQKIFPVLEVYDGASVKQSELREYCTV